MTGVNPTRANVKVHRALLIGPSGSGKSSSLRAFYVAAESVVEATAFARTSGYSTPSTLSTLRYADYLESTSELRQDYVGLGVTHGATTTQRGANIGAVILETPKERKSEYSVILVEDLPAPGNLHRLELTSDLLEEQVAIGEYTMREKLRGWFADNGIDEVRFKYNAPTILAYTPVSQHGRLKRPEQAAESLLTSFNASPYKEDLVRIVSRKRRGAQNDRPKYRVENHDTRRVEIKSKGSSSEIEPLGRIIVVPSLCDTLDPQLGVANSVPFKEVSAFSLESWIYASVHGMDGSSFPNTYFHVSAGLTDKPRFPLVEGQRNFNIPMNVRDVDYVVNFPPVGSQSHPNYTLNSSFTVQPSNFNLEGNHVINDTIPRIKLISALESIALDPNNKRSIAQRRQINTFFANMYSTIESVSGHQTLYFPVRAGMQSPGLKPQYVAKTLESMHTLLNNHNVWTGAGRYNSVV